MVRAGSSVEGENRARVRIGFECPKVEPKPCHPNKAVMFSDGHVPGNRTRRKGCGVLPSTEVRSVVATSGAPPVTRRAYRSQDQERRRIPQDAQMAPITPARMIAETRITITLWKSENPCAQNPT